MRPALFIEDIQNIWLYDPDSNQALRRSVEKRFKAINQAIDWFRERGLPIIVGYTEDKGIGLLPGTRSFEVPSSVRVERTDYRVTKTHASAFGNPKLGKYLKRKRCDTVVITGLSASGCVLATYFGALDWEIHPYLLKGCVASHKEEHVRFAEEICETITLSKLGAAIRQPR